MEGNGSFYDLLKEEYRKKKVVDVAKVTRENILKKFKRFLASLSRRELISEAIAQIAEIQGIFEKEEYLEECGMTQSDLDLILLIRATVLSSGNQWQEAENLLYQLTEKYDDAALYALLGVVKNKRRIFKCSRDTLTVAQLQLKQFHTRPFKFHEIDVDITNLTPGELRNAVNLMIAYTKDMKEWPSKFVPMDNILELNLVEPNGRRMSVGKIVRDIVFPIIREKIDSMLRIVEPETVKSCSVSDKSTQTESNHRQHQSASKETQSEIIKFAKKSTQTTLDKPSQKMNKEVLCLKANLKTALKENGILTMQLTVANENLKSLESKHIVNIYNLEQQIEMLRTTVNLQERTNFDLQLSSKNLLKMIYKEIHVVQKKMCEEAKIKYDMIDAVIVALRDELEHMGLKRELDAAVKNTADLRRDAINLEYEIDQRYQHVNQLIVSNELDQLLSVPFVDTVVNDPPNILLEFVSKLVPMCQNNRAYRAELRPDSQSDPPGPSREFRSTLDLEFPPIPTWRRQRKRPKPIEQAEFENYITNVQSHLPNCPREQIVRCVHALRTQHRVHWNEIEVHNVVDFLNSTQQNANANSVSIDTSDVFWDATDGCDQSETICPICLDSCVDNVTVLDCAHVYHSPCILEWLNSNNRCPICRQVIRLADYNFCT